MSLAKHAERQLSQHTCRLNAFISRAPASLCLQDIQGAAARESTGSRKSAIDGHLIAVKDNICTANLPTTCGSSILQNYFSPFDATVVRQLKDAGAVIVGKTNLDEFGMGSHNTNSAAGSVINPLPSELNEPHSAGGSSGGSAVAVADGSCFVALGTDTGGSVRLPAAYCKVVGFKPSYGRISRYGVVAYANSLDTVGLLGKRVDDVKAVYEVLDRNDAKDPSCLTAVERRRIDGITSPAANGKLKMGIPRQYNIAELDPAIRRAWQRTAIKLMSAGHEIVAVDLPSTRSALAAYYILAPAEASSNLAKYDGVKFGVPSRGSRSTADVLFARTRYEGLGMEVRRRILLGSYSLSSTAIDNYFKQAQRIRRKVQAEFNQVFAAAHPLRDNSADTSADGVDLLIVPTAPTAPPALSAIDDRSPVDKCRDDVFTVPASLAGLPAISVPLGIETNDNVPSMQLIGQYGNDSAVLEAAGQLESLFR